MPRMYRLVGKDCGRSERKLDFERVSSFGQNLFSARGN